MIVQKLTSKIEKVKIGLSISNKRRLNLKLVFKNKVYLSQFLYTIVLLSTILLHIFHVEQQQNALVESTVYLLNYQ
jgi:hypothetical protein